MPDQSPPSHLLNHLGSLRPGVGPRSLSAEERKLVEGLWPVELLEDPLRQPRYVSSAKDFLKEVLTGEHLGDFIILPNGTELLGLPEEDVIPTDLLESLKKSSTVESLLRTMLDDQRIMSRYKAGLEYVDKKGEQRSILPKERRNLPGRIKEILRLVESKEVDPESLYIAELRLLEEKQHPHSGEEVKTVCLADVKDVIGPLAAWTFYWDRHDEGVFIGNKLSGKGVHVDQVLWSNVGKNWRGYKLVAAWPKGAVSNRICREFDDQLFSPPLSAEKLLALTEAAKIVLLRPGDVYFFSGGTAHTALCASEGLGLSSYESIVTLHPLHSGLVMQTCDKSSPCWLEGAMPDEEFEDILEEATEQLQDAAEQLLKGGPGTELPLKKELPKEPFKVPPLWKRIRAELCEDKVTMALLQEHFTATVALCSTRSPYIRKHFSQEVLRAQKGLMRGTLGIFSTDESTASGSPSRSRSRSRSPLCHRAPPDRGALKAWS